MTEQPEPKRPTVHPDTAKDRTRELSSRALDVCGVEGETTPTGPMVKTDGQRGGNYYVHHAWSVGGVSPEKLRAGMENLHRKLPESGWMIEKYGKATSRAQQLQLEAFHEKEKFLMQVELLIRSTRDPGDAHPNASGEDLLSFTVMSPTYKAPKGVEPHGG